MTKMDQKASMLEAVKRKRFLLQHEQDSSEEHNEGQSTHSDDDELAPNSSASHDALLGKPGGKNDQDPAESQADSDNETAEGQDGFPKISKATAPENSNNQFLNPKKDTHDPVDLNADKNMAGPDAENTQHDEMGVDTHKDVRTQSSKMAKNNAHKDEGIKNSTRKDVKGKMSIPDVVPSHGEDNPDASPDERVNDKPRLTGMKGARAKLDSFFGRK